MIKDLFRPRHLLDPWRDDLVIALRLRNISGSQIGDALTQVDVHCTDSGEEAFGDPVAYATHVAEQVRPVDLDLSMSPLRAGLLGCPCSSRCRRCCPVCPALHMVALQNSAVRWSGLGSVRQP